MIRSIALGAFDGIHLAHQELIRRVDGVVIIERGNGRLTPGFVREQYIAKPKFFYHFDKETLEAGNIKVANRLLGRAYKICGTVIAGQGVGKKQLVPTINLKVQDYILPKEGVYVTQTVIDGICYESVSFIGHRESTDGSFAVETHILDKDIQAVFEKVEIVFLDFIRENRKFDDLDRLKKQIDLDIKTARQSNER
ncbi:MAG: riboflavin kinase [Sulfurovaceae bacterium]